MNEKQQQELINEMLFTCENKENDFPIINLSGEIVFPILSPAGIVRGYKEGPQNYKGLALEVNERGNVTVWKCFKNGTRKEIASRV